MHMPLLLSSRVAWALVAPLVCLLLFTISAAARIHLQSLWCITCTRFRKHWPPACSRWRLQTRIRQFGRISLPRKGCRVGLRIVLFEACSAFTRVTACTLALSPIRDTHSEGFSYFVTSIAAPVASGWVGFAPTGKRRLVTAHTQVGHS